MNKKFFSFLFFLLISEANSKECFSRPSSFTTNHFNVDLLEYLPQKSRGHIILVPPTGGTNVIDRSYARSLCAAGFMVHVLNHWSDDDEFNLELEIHKRFYGRAHQAIKNVVAKIPDGKFIGILGTSVGGLHAAIAASYFPKITAAFIITGGAHIPGIIAHSTQGAMINAWEHRRKTYGFKTKDQYIKALEKVIELEPQDLTSSGKYLGMVVGLNDTVVPIKNQRDLQELWKPKKIINYSFDHLFTIICAWLFHTNEIVAFFVNAQKS